jgi:hypothetical protein
MNRDRALAAISVLALVCVVLAGLFGGALALRRPTDPRAWSVSSWE